MSGRYHRGRGGSGGLGRTSLAGLLNATAANDADARSHAVWTFAPLLGLVLVLDVSSALGAVWMHCRLEQAIGTDSGRDDHCSGGGRGISSSIDGSTTATTSSFEMSHCLWKQLTQGIPLLQTSPFSSEYGLGDLFWLSLVRCLWTAALLMVGIRYGRHRKARARRSPRNDPSSPDNGALAAINESCIHVDPALHPSTAENDSLVTPLLSDQDVDVVASSLEEQAPPRTVATPEEPPSSSSSSSSELSSQAPWLSLSSWWKRLCVGGVQNPETIQAAVLVALFAGSTLFQVYAGLKVSSYDPPSCHDNHDHHESSSSSSHNYLLHHLLTVLLCATVLWINLTAYLVRALLTEVTRPDGLFLPPHIHRHPVFYQQSRALAVHWCDLCRQRIRTTPAAGSSARGTTTTTPMMTGCYRCTLCDFDVCVPCSQRSDAATVGENVLRGDRGVRVEASLDNGSYARRSLQIAQPELPLLLVSFGLLAASSVARLLLPHFQGHIIDKVIPQGEDGTYDVSGFSYYIKVYIYIMLGQGALSTLYSAIFTLVSRRLKFTIRNSLFERILAQDVAYFDGTESGRLISRLTNDLDLMMSPIQSSLSNLLSNVLILIGGMIMCFLKSYRLSMLAFVVVGPITYLWEQYAQWSKGLAREMLSYWAEGNSIASQALSHIRTVKAFGCEDTVIGKYTEANKHALDRGVKDAWGNGITSALTGYLDMGAGVLILYYGGHLVYRGEMTVGELVTFQLFWNMMNNAYQNLQGLVTSFTRSAAGAEKIFSLWDSEPDINPSDGSSISWNVAGHLQLKNVDFYYQMRPDNLVLNQFNLDIPAGKTIALVGRSGGGKSTIINLLLRFYDARAGTISIDGQPYDSLRVHELRRLFGVVTQETELFALTVEQNIAYGLESSEYTIEDVHEAAKKACAFDFITEMKDGFQTRIGERGNRLSGGQRQRIAIARVFLRRPKIILLDEATSALDEHSQDAVQQALATLMAESNATVVLVAHRLSTVMNAHSIVVIDQGVALEQGNHAELVAQDGIYASMVQKQNKKKEDHLDQEKKDAKDKSPSKTTVADDDIDALLDNHTSVVQRQDDIKK